MNTQYKLEMPIKVGKEYAVPIFGDVIFPQQIWENS